MKHFITTFFMLLAFSAGVTSCDTDDIVSTLPGAVQPSSPTDPDESDNNDNNNQDDNNSMSNNLKISVGSASFKVTLEDNATVTAFKALLPMTVNMSEMNGNEKYYYLPDNLPVASSNPHTIQTGDLMLYGSSCLVLFYKSFSTSYSYTRMGRVDDPAGLVSALGSGNVNITFEMQ